MYESDEWKQVVQCPLVCTLLHLYMYGIKCFAHSDEMTSSLITDQYNHVRYDLIVYASSSIPKILFLYR